MQFGLFFQNPVTYTGCKVVMDDFMKQQFPGMICHFFGVGWSGIMWHVRAIKTDK